jgi:hypothetical protein
MKITQITATLLVIFFGLIRTEAQSVETVAVSKLPKETGPVFGTQGGGLVVSASLPPIAPDLKSIVLNLKLINKAGTDRVLRDYSYLCGFDFHLEDSSHHEMKITQMFTNARAGGIGWSTSILKNSFANVITIPLEKYCPITKFGKYLLKVDWRELKHVGGWEPDPIPKFQFEGSFLVQKADSGISITVAQ